MSATTLRLGTSVCCAEEPVGEVADAVIDPATRRLTHVVARTPDDRMLLVPVELLAAMQPDSRTIGLVCSRAEFEALEPIREFAYVRFEEIPQPGEGSDVGVEDVLFVPSAGALEFGDYAGELEGGVGVTYDRIPRGEAELRRTSAVVTADGKEVGNLDGFLVSDGQVTHVVLERGHLWGTRVVRIPIDAVETIETDRVALRLSAHELAALPASKPEPH